MGFKPTISLSSLVGETLTKIITMVELVRDMNLLGLVSSIEQFTVKDGEQSQEKNRPEEYVGVFLSSANIFPK